MPQLGQNAPAEIEDMQLFGGMQVSCGAGFVLATLWVALLYSKE